MNMRNWEVFTVGPRKGSGGHIASITGDIKRPVLHIGRKLIDQGFDITKKYELLFDRGNKYVGLRESTDGYKVAVNHCITLAPFCRHFGIKVRLMAIKASQEDGVWVLEMEVR